MRRLLIALTFGAALHAAAPVPQQQIASHLILVKVTDENGRPVVNVDADDFVVREGDQSLDVLSVQVADYPIAIVLDNGRGAGRELEAIRRAALRFIGRLGHRPLAIGASSSSGLVASFNDDRAVAIERLRKIRNSGPRDGLSQAVLAAARALQETGTPFSAIVVLVANGGGGAPSDLVGPILDSGAHVHAVIQQRPASGRKPAQRQSLEWLGELVDQTHGQLTTIYAPDAYDLALDRLAAELGPELMVEYVAPADSAGGRVQMGVGIAGAHISSRGVWPRR